MIQPIRTLVVDDDRAARDELLDLLRRDPELLVVGDVGIGAAPASIGRLTPDLLLLDVGTAEPDALALLRTLPAVGRPDVVFVTANPQYALHAFEAHALDYLLRPFTPERFAEAMRQAKARVCQRRIAELGRQLAALLQPDGTPAASGPADGAAVGPASGALPVVGDARGRDATGHRIVVPWPDEPPRSRFLDRIVVRHGRDTLFVSIDELDWISAADYYVQLHAGGKSYLVRETMQRMEARLDPRRFARIHRSTIVNVDRVKRIQTASRGVHTVLLRDGTQLQMSRGRREMLEAALGQPL